MATAGLNRMMLWGDLEGRQLEERWLLGRLVRPEGRTAWFEAIDPDGVPVMLSVTEALNDEDELLARLSAAAEIRHPNVVAIREATISHLDDTPVVVGVMEMTEENLGDVLRERTLSAAEGRQVLDAVLAALGALHGHGLVHKHMEAGSVLAMGETIKLRSDCVQMGGSAFGTAAADDVRAAARMATHAVTGRYPAGENDPVLQLLPEPMARAVRRALSGNAGATEVAALAGTRLELMPEIARDTARVEPHAKARRRWRRQRGRAAGEACRCERADAAGVNPEETRRGEGGSENGQQGSATGGDETGGRARAGRAVWGSVHAAQRARNGRGTGDGAGIERGQMARSGLRGGGRDRGGSGDGLHAVRIDASGAGSNGRRLRRPVRRRRRQPRSPRVRLR